MNTISGARESHWAQAAVPAVVALALLASGCEGDDAPGPSDAGPSAPQVQRYASPNPGSVNAYWVETTKGVVVIDSGRNVSGGRQVADVVAAIGKPVLAVLVTHAHPDHIGGLAVLEERFPTTPVYASRGTDTLMREDPLGFLPLARMADPDYPPQIGYATQLFDEGATLAIGDLRFETREFADAESITATVYREATFGLIFVGDLLAAGVTPALIEGHSCGWLEQLEPLRTAYQGAGSVYPGHGDAGPFDAALTATADYLRTMRELVRPAIASGSDGGSALTDTEKKQTSDQMSTRYPNYPPVASLPDLVSVNIDAVAGELAGEDAKTLPSICQP